VWIVDLLSQFAKMQH